MEATTYRGWIYATILFGRMDSRRFWQNSAACAAGLFAKCSGRWPSGGLLYFRVRIRPHGRIQREAVASRGRRMRRFHRRWSISSFYLLLSADRRKYFVGLTWANGDAKGGFAMQCDKNDYGGVLAGLEGFTGKKAVDSEAMTVKN
jgi:hypothetical protein